MTDHPSIAAIGAPPKAFNLASYVLQHAAVTPEKIALRLVGSGADATWTYGALAAEVAARAGGLLSQGLTTGDRVLMRLGNTPDFPITFLAALHAGLVPIPTSSQLTGAEVTAIAAETAPKLVVAAAGLALPDQPVPVVACAALGRVAPVPAALGDPDRPGYIIYTSGTSGRPRPVLHAHRAVWARQMMWDGWYGLRGNDVMLHAGAFNWTYTLGTGLMDPWAIGATAVIPAEGVDIAALPALLDTTGATIFAAAPGVYRRLVRAAIPPLPRLRHGLSAGEKMPAVTAARWREATGTQVYEAYGMTECSTFISTAPGRDSADLGWPQPGRRIALLGDDGPVTAGDAGVIAVHKDDPGLMLGYLDAPAETAARFRGDWFMTGDIGRAQPDGAIRYEGRVDDMMNAGGYRVSPIEVETALSRHPAIAEIAAVELRIRDDVSVIAAFYVAAHPLDQAELTAFAARTLAAYKVPRLFERVDALPRGANNKILRRQLRHDWEKQHGQA